MFAQVLCKHGAPPPPPPPKAPVCLWYDMEHSLTESTPSHTKKPSSSAVKCYETHCLPTTSYLLPLTSYRPWQSRYSSYLVHLVLVVAYHGVRRESHRSDRDWLDVQGSPILFCTSLHSLTHQSGKGPAGPDKGKALTVCCDFTPTPYVCIVLYCTVQPLPPCPHASPVVLYTWHANYK